MSQAGWNCGPRHARVLGFAKSYRKGKDEDIKTAHDLDIITAGSLTWQFVLAYMPSEVTDEVNEKLHALNMPSLGTSRIPQGMLQI